MSASNPVLILSREAADNIHPRRLVTHGNAHPTTSGERVLGASQTSAGPSSVFAVVVLGTALVEAGAPITNGDLLIADNHGRAIPATGSEHEFVFGEALSPASTEGKFLEVLLRH